MSTITKPKINIFSALRNFFNSEIIETPEEIKFPEELKKTLESLKVKEKIVETAINNPSSSKKGGFSNKINPKTENAMRAMHKKVQEKSLNEGKERE